MSKSVFGVTYIGGQPWTVALPDAGDSLAEAEQSEFAQVSELVGSEAFHTHMASWCGNHGSARRWDEEEGYYWDEAGQVCQYDGKKVNWNLEREDYRGYGTGFRPVLIPAGPIPAHISSMKDGETYFPSSANEEHLEYEAEFDFAPQPLQSVPQKDISPGREEDSLDSRLAAASARSASAKNQSVAKPPENQH